MAHGQSEAELLTPSASDCALLKIDKILSSTPRMAAAGNIIREAFVTKLREAIRGSPMAGLEPFADDTCHHRRITTNRP